MKEEDLKLIVKAVQIGALYDIIRTLGPLLVLSLIIYVISGESLSTLEIIGSSALGILLHKIGKYIIRVIWAKKEIINMFNIKIKGE